MEKMKHGKKGWRVFLIVVILLAIVLVLFDRFFLAVPLDVQNKPFDGETLSQDQRLEDYDYLYSILKENYPYFSVNRTGFSLENAYQDYRDRIAASVSNEEFLGIITELLARFGNGHTNMEYLNWDQASFTKKAFFCLTPRRAIVANKDIMRKISYWEGLRDQMENKGAASGDEDLPWPGEVIQTQIIKPGEIAYLRVNNCSTGREYMKKIDTFLREVKSYPYLIIDIRWNGGGSDFVWKDHIVRPLTKKDYRADFYVAAKNGAYIQPFLEGLIGGFGFSYGSRREAADFKEALGPSFPRDYENWSVIQEPYVFSQNRDGGFKGKIYLLTGGSVFSASETFAAFCKESGFATLVGTRTGGDGIGYDPVHLVLPNSGILIRFPVTLSVNNGGINELTATDPDIPVAQDSHLQKQWYEDIRNGKLVSDYDTVLQECLKLCR